ncbi:hypothetical protein [Enorma sp.]
MRLLIVDDFMGTTVTAESAADLFKIMKARGEHVLIASQLEPSTSGT